MKREANDNARSTSKNRTGTHKVIAPKKEVPPQKGKSGKHDFAQNRHDAMDGEI